MQEKKVNLYLECNTTVFGKKERLCGYVLEYITEKGPVTLVDYREGRGTYNREFLRGLAEALERVKEPCVLSIYGQNRFVMNMLRDRLKDWAAEDFISNGRPIMNQEEWRRIWEQVQKHKVTVELGEHAYSRWLLSEMEDKNAGITEKQSN